MFTFTFTFVYEMLGTGLVG